VNEVLPPERPENGGEPPHREEQHIEVTYQRTSWTAPLPPPEFLAKFSEAVKDGGERIFREFEEEAAHRRLLQSIGLRASIAERRLAQWLAFAFAIACLLLAGGSIWLGKEIAGGIIGGGGIAAVVTAFLRSPRPADEKPEAAPAPKVDKPIPRPARGNGRHRSRGTTSDRRCWGGSSPRLLAGVPSLRMARPRGWIPGAECTFQRYIFPKFC
jgi:uncharacterized membrane protein